MEIQQVECYKFEELNQDVRERLIEKEIKFLYDAGEIDDVVKEVLTDKVNTAGYPASDIRYSLSYSQGDGVAICCKNKFNLCTYPKRLGIDLAACLGDRLQVISGEPWISAEIRLSGHIQIFEDEKTIPDEYFEVWNSLLQADMKKLSNELKAAGYEVIESMTKPEYVIESLEGKNRWYLSNGTEMDYFIK